MFGKILQIKTAGRQVQTCPFMTIINNIILVINYPNMLMGGPRGPLGLGGGPSPGAGAAPTGGLGGGPGGRPSGGPSPCPCAPGVLGGCPCGRGGPVPVLITDRALSGGGIGLPVIPATLRALSGIVTFGLPPCGRGGGEPRGVG